MAEETAQHEILRSALLSAIETIKACLWINAGAAAVIVAAMTQLMEKGEYDPVVTALEPAVKWFIFGAVAAIFGHALSYWTNLSFARWTLESQSAAVGFRIATAFVVIASIVFFAIGAFTATWSLYRLNESRPRPAYTASEVIDPFGSGR